MMLPVKPKKALGQHFLRDENTARKIVASLPEGAGNILEIGPGTGILTKYLLQKETTLYFIDTDRESIAYLLESYPGNEDRFIKADFLKYDFAGLFEGRISIIGNFPYNISSQIFFRVLENRDRVDHVVGMVQKEVAERMASGPGTKKYGILSVLLQAFYHIEYLFTVNETVFVPQPKVKSAVIRLIRNDVTSLDCSEEMFFKVVKAGFNQRRKTIRNSLKAFYIDFTREEIKDLEGKRPEQLGVAEFVLLARLAI
jgi:16S rRNA (adenine1518-N6/adenine1519-N6)-dimethyltransferase